MAPTGVKRQLVVSLPRQPSQCLYARLTQRLECLLYTQDVGGSNPSPCIFWDVVQWLEQPLDKRRTKVQFLPSQPFIGKKCYGSTEVSKSLSVGSTPSFPAFFEVVTQLAECQFSKLDVAGSTPVYLTLRW